MLNALLNLLLGGNRERSSPPPDYTIKHHNRDDFIYREGDHALTIRGEMCIGPIDFMIYSGGIKNWDPPHANEPIDSEKKRQILERLDPYMKKLGIKYELDDTSY